VNIQFLSLAPRLTAAASTELAGASSSSPVMIVHSVGGSAALPFDRYTVEEADHKRDRCGSDPGKARLRQRLLRGALKSERVKTDLDPMKAQEVCLLRFFSTHLWVSRWNGPRKDYVREIILLANLPSSNFSLFSAWMPPRKAFFIRFDRRS
jgi:hypothetical protein